MLKPLLVFFLSAVLCRAESEYTNNYPPEIRSGVEKGFYAVGFANGPGPVGKTLDRIAVSVSATNSIRQHIWLPSDRSEVALLELVGPDGSKVGKREAHGKAHSRFARLPSKFNRAKVTRIRTESAFPLDVPAYVFDIKEYVDYRLRVQVQFFGIVSGKTPQLIKLPVVELPLIHSAK